MSFLYIKNYPRFASGEPDSLKASPAFEEQVLSLSLSRFGRGCDQFAEHNGVSSCPHLI